ncbi:threonine synthase [Congregibacter litoralis]|uniref:Threonine synthase n=1 Tax=Congregibacter litoralis KT71 TaxID=314285 RepID=A4ADF6_9GAMM|nr:threonine synthase [Congregibacter litoralis]EAQ95954.2 threonine synthase [Congregibacter litoralis KT71]
MRYISTRGSAPTLSFEEVLLTGLASDGGLYVPESLPSFTSAELEAMASLDYPSLAHRILLPFVEEAFTGEELREIIDDTYAVFRHSAVAPLVQLDHNQWVLELFHGPTLAFKDFALQLLGRLLDAILKRRGEKVVIMGATSGDTGSAAIAGCERCENIDIFILHPHGRVSEVQRRQMTTLSAPTIHNLAIEGNFDDCQAMVKASFRDQSFLPDGRRLVAVNSINWARIMAQIVYYFYAGLRLGAPHRAAAYSVPTGNFGDIFAGYLASKMGLPVAQLMIATNRNDVLHRLLSTGDYARQTLEHTLSPSMDISVSSNFERLMFDLYERDGAAIASLMAAFDDGDITLSDAAMEKARQLFASHRVDDAQTLACIADVWGRTEYLLDPHSAIGYAAATQPGANTQTPWVTLATAHPAKFPDAIKASAVGTTAQLPVHLADLFERSEHFDVLPNDIAAVQRFMSGHLGA